jgi:POT family proton-dependent oligopeptide transporter
LKFNTDWIRSNISPLIAEQYREEVPYIKTLKNGDRVIVDPAATISRIYLYFYMMINIGSILGQVSMVYAEKYVGFWLSYFLPTMMYLGCPAVLFFCRNKYHLVKPTGSVYNQAIRLWRLAMKGRWSLNPARMYVSCLCVCLLRLLTLTAGRRTRSPSGIRSSPLLWVPTVPSG